ncbi:hypothetical protein C8Q80DRAFT_794357 [Daedaleopsis nitida]|nr:hypothetical protein C8Q80DRAFT_794357 [Daedaleopsis nitida]
MSERLPLRSTRSLSGGSSTSASSCETSRRRSRWTRNDYRRNARSGELKYAVTHSPCSISFPEILSSQCDEVSAECRRLGDELDKLKRPPPPYRPVESRYFYLHDQTGAKAEPVALSKDNGLDSRDTNKIQIVGKEDLFHLSPVPATQPIPDLPPSIMSILPMTDELDDPIDDDRSHSGTNPVSVSSASRSISIKSRSNTYRDRARSNSSLLTRPDPDAMSISVPRSNLDVHMGSCSTSPSSAQHGPRPAEFSPGSVGRSSDNILGLRADSNRVSPSAIDPELREKQEQSKMVAQLREVLQDPITDNSPRKSSISSGIDRERARTAASSAFTTTRTPSPVSTSSRQYEKEYGPAPIKSSLLSVPNPTAISCASHAAAERERARASSVNSQNAPSPSPQSPSGPPHHPGPAMSSTSLSHITATRDRENATPLYSIYGGAAPQAQAQARPPHTRKHSAETSSLSSVSGSISKGKASALGIAPSAAYPSGLTRSMRAMQEAPRVS